MRLYQYRRWGRLFLAVVLVYLLICLFIVSFLHNLDGNINSISLMENVVMVSHDAFGSKQSKLCSSRQDRYIAVASSTVLHKQDSVENSMCPKIKYDGTDINILSESVLDEMSVGYPNLVLTVTGWVDTIQVAAWTVKPLQVIIVPHSHQDPGWLKTIDTYFSTKASPTLDLIVQQLTDHPTWTFIWSEIIFLQMWWNAASKNQKQQFKRLLDRGQLELVNGGLVMPDETVTHFAAILDQLQEGHQWIKQTLNTSVENGWAIDPFGHSSTMAYLCKQAGLKNMVIQRTHFAIKRYLAARKQLEFHWRQIWDHTGESDMFTHMMPFLLYSIPHACGPDRHVCCKFDFNQKQCFHGNKQKAVVKVTDDNVAELAHEFWEQLQKKSELYQSGVVLLPHGDDFRYHTKDEWSNQFDNLQKLIDHINASPNLHMTLRFGTLRDYFNAVHSDTAITYPILGGDLLPYSDRSDQYWSGFYTSRPKFKSHVRRLQSLLRSAEILVTLSMPYATTDVGHRSQFKSLDECRRTLALSLHHDAITGTSRHNVMEDYTERVLQSIDKAVELQREAAQSLLHRGHTRTFHLSNGMPDSVVIKKDELPMVLYIWNSLETQVRDVMHVKVNEHNVHVLNAFRGYVRYQISPVWSTNTTMERGKFTLSFEVDIPPLSLSTYTVEASRAATGAVADVHYVPNTTGYLKPDKSYPFRINMWPSDEIAISNSRLTATFSVCDGMLQCVDDHITGTRYKSDLGFVTYSTGRNTHPFRDKSGAYIFLPDGVAKYVVEQPMVFVIQGHLFSQVKAFYKDMVHTATLYRLSDSQDPLCKGVLLENHVDLSSPRWDNMELALRIETNVVNGNQQFCTDSNGFQLHQRTTRAKLSIQGNFYPMTSMVMLESRRHTASLISTYSHAVASLASGWLEVMLDRRLIQDDWRGLKEGIVDNVPVTSTFFLMFQQLKQGPSEKQYLCLPSVSSNHVSNVLNNPLSVFTRANISSATSNKEKRLHKTNEKDTRYPSEFLSSKLQQRLSYLPCGYHIINLKMIEPIALSQERTVSQDRQAMLTIHRVGLSCNIVADDAYACDMKTDNVTFSDLPLDIIYVAECTATTGTDIKPVNIAQPIHLKPMTIKTYKITFR